MKAMEHYSHLLLEAIILCKYIKSYLRIKVCSIILPCTHSGGHPLEVFCPDYPFDNVHAHAEPCISVSPYLESPLLLNTALGHKLGPYVLNTSSLSFLLSDSAPVSLPPFQIELSPPRVIYASLGKCSRLLFAFYSLQALTEPMGESQLKFASTCFLKEVG